MELKRILSQPIFKQSKYFFSQVEHAVEPMCKSSPIISVHSPSQKSMKCNTALFGQFHCQGRMQEGWNTSSLME